MSSNQHGPRTMHCLNCGASLTELPPPPDADPVFDDQRHSVHGIRLTHQEWTLLQMFRLHPGRLITRDQAIQALWGETYDEPEWANSTIKCLISRIRQKLAYRQTNSNWHIETVWGEGYIGRRIPAEQLVSPEP